MMIARVIGHRIANTKRCCFLRSRNGVSRIAFCSSEVGTSTTSSTNTCSSINTTTTSTTGTTNRTNHTFTTWQQLYQQQKRSHMNHGYDNKSSKSNNDTNNQHSHHDHTHSHTHDDDHHDHQHNHNKTTTPGTMEHYTKQPRLHGIEIGLQGASCIHNILRLLETSYGPTSFVYNANEYCWHPTGKRWIYDERLLEWNVQSVFQQQGHNHDHDPSISTTIPSLLWIMFSDSRTALLKIIGNDGKQRYLSLLQLDDHKPYNDGWRITREVISTVTGSNHVQNNKSSNLHINDIQTILRQYLAIEHGGGIQDKEHAKLIFNQHATLLTVGSSTTTTDTSMTTTNNPWIAPYGHLLEISLNTYFHGIVSQKHHEPNSSLYDSIVLIDTLPCGTAAAAIVRVGNGSQTHIFEDHLILGRNNINESFSVSSASEQSLLDQKQQNEWCILSKTFSQHPWPIH